MKRFFFGLIVYLLSLAVAVVSAFWFGIYFFSDPHYAAGTFPVSREIGYFIYGLLISYPLFISLGLTAFLEYRNVWITLIALLPIYIFVIAFGPDLIGYSISATLAGGAVGIIISFVFRKKARL